MGDDRFPSKSRDVTDGDRKRLDELDDRLREARRDSQPAGHQATRLSGAQVGYRVGVEMLAGVIGGAGVGWLLDRLLGTNPWLMVVLLFMGFAAGVLNAYRAGKRAAALVDDPKAKL